MDKYRFILNFVVSVFFCSNLAHSQSGWFWQNPLPQGNDLLSVKFLNQNTGFVVGNAGCFMKTTNGGITWIDKYFIGGIEIFNATPRTLNTLYFINTLTGFAGTSSFDNNKILRTTNAGETWDSVTASTYPSFKTIFFFDSLTGWSCSSPTEASTVNGVLKTTNGGLNWFVQNTTLNPVYSCCFVSSQTGWLVGFYHIPYPANVSAYYIYKTTNGGASYITQLYSSQSEVLKSVFFINENTGWAGGTKLWKTTDSGISWNAQNILVNSVAFGNALTGYFVNDSGVSKTTNSGNSWFLQSMLAGNSISVLDSNNAFVAGKYGTLFKTNNGGNNWISLSSSVTTGDYLFSVFFVNNLTGYTIGNSGNVFNEVSKMLKTTNSGINWTIISNLSNSYVYDMYFLNSNTGWVAGSNILKKTTDGGLNWVTQLTNTCYSIYFVDQNTGWAPADGYNVLCTTNGGTTWSSRTTPISNTYTTFVHFFNSNTGVIITGFGIERTTNGGINWQLVSNLSCYDGSKDDSNNLYAKTYNSLYKSTDLGSSWNLISQSIPTNIFSIQMINPQIGYGSGLSGFVAKTTNGGMDWNRQISKYGNQLRSIFFTDELTGWVVGDGGAILSTVDGGGNFVGINSTELELPEEFLLHQNYPNPFNPITKIKFAISSNANSEKSNVKIVVYDILGREIEVLFDAALKSGTYDVEWNGSNFPSGVYFYRLESGDYVQSKKMVLVK